MAADDSQADRIADLMRQAIEGSLPPDELVEQLSPEEIHAVLSLTGQQLAAYRERIEADTERRRQQLAAHELFRWAAEQDPLEVMDAGHSALAALQESGKSWVDLLALIDSTNADADMRRMTVAALFALIVMTCDDGTPLAWLRDEWRRDETDDGGER
jgi:hypothetical protein